MYRQILVHPNDRPFQRILFQKSSQDPVKDYQLKTVTFGVNCAPYLAIRTLWQLAQDNRERFPLASNALQKETYVDDILTGGHSIESAIACQIQLMQSLAPAGFILKKFTANNSLLLEAIPKEDLYDSEFLKFYDSSFTKTLGIRWNALTDSFTYSFAAIPLLKHVTKRQALSSVAKLFDPAGWLGPVIVKGKFLIQQLWLEKIGMSLLAKTHFTCGMNSIPTYKRHRNLRRSPAIHQCKVCDRFHPLKFCKSFVAMSVEKRRQVATQYRYCLNCLARTHTVRDCDSPNTCSACSELHNTLLHPNRHTSIEPPVRSVQDRLGRASSSSNHSNHTNKTLRSKPSKKRGKRKPKKTNSKNSTPTPQPDQSIISEAIRSLANVLCASSSKFNIA